MYCRKQTNLWELIVVLFIILVSGCSANSDIKIKSPHSEALESTKEESLNVEKPAEGSSGRQITEVSLEDIEGPGRRRLNQSKIRCLIFTTFHWTGHEWFL